MKPRGSPEEGNPDVIPGKLRRLKLVRGAQMTSRQAPLGVRGKTQRGTL